MNVQLHRTFIISSHLSGQTTTESCMAAGFPDVCVSSQSRINSAPERMLRFLHYQLCQYLTYDRGSWSSAGRSCTDTALTRVLFQRDRRKKSNKHQQQVLWRYLGELTGYRSQFSKFQAGVRVTFYVLIFMFSGSLLGFQALIQVSRFLVTFFPLSLSFTQVTCFPFCSCTSSLITSPQHLVSRFPSLIAKSSPYLSCFMPQFLPGQVLTLVC